MALDIMAADADVSAALLLPGDVLIAIAEAAGPRTLASMVQTCVVWNHQIKGALASLSPAYLDAPYAPGHDFTGVNSLCLSLIRTKYDSLVVQPLRSVPPGAGMGWHGGPGTAVTDLGNRFTTLKSLDLSGQLLVSSLLDSLTRLPALNSLQLEGCTLGLQELASSVSRITNLQALNLAGVRAVEASAQPTIPTPQAALRAATLRKNSHTAGIPFPPPDPTALSRQQPAFTAALSQLLHGLSQLPKLQSLDLSQLPAVRASAMPGHAPSVSLDGLPMLGLGAALSALTKLTGLHLRGNWLTVADMQHLGHCTQLQSLSLCWPPLSSSSGAPDGSSGIVGEEGLLALAWAESVERLTQLRSLSVDMHSPDLMRLGTRMSVAPLTRLTSLHFEGCCSVGLALSIMALKELRVLGLAGSHALVASPELVVQVASALPKLQELDVSHSKPHPQHEPFGDILVRGLSLVRPTLRVLTMEDCNICGTGLPPSGCLPAVERLAVGGKTLLACKYQHLGTLSNLCSLTLTGVSPRTLVSAAKSGGYQELSRLTRLTQLHVLAAAAPPGLPPGLGEGEGGPNGGVPGGAGGMGPGAGLGPGLVPGLQGGAGGVGVVVQVQGQGQAAQHAGHVVVAGAALPNGVAVGAQQQQLVGQAVAAGGQQQAGAHQVPFDPLQGIEDEEEEGEGAEQEHWEEAEEGEGGEVLVVGAEVLVVGAEAAGGPVAPGPVQAVPQVQLPGQAGVLSAVRASQNRYREPHLHFVTLLPQLQVLVLQSLQSNGTCLRHLAPLTGLKQLSLQGQLSLTWAGIECLAALRLSTLESFSLGTCDWWEGFDIDGCDAGPFMYPPGSAAGPSGATGADEAGPSTSCAATGAGHSADTGPSRFMVQPPGSSSSRRQASGHPGVVHLLGAVARAMPQLQSLHLDGCAGLALADLPALNPLPHLSYLGLHALPRELHDRRAAVATALSRHPSLQFVHATHAHGARGPGFMLLRTRGRLHELASVAVGEVGAGGRGGGRH